jgi:hypothetical protein
MNRIPPYVNVRPAMMRQIPWPWLRQEQTLRIPLLTSYYDWHTFMLEDCEAGDWHTMGTRNHKSIFSTAERCLGLADLLLRTPPLSPITDEYLAWNRQLFRSSPVDIDRFVIGDKIADANGPLIPPEVFRLWLAHEYKRLLSFADEQECLKVMLLSGDVYDLLDEIIPLGLDHLYYEPVGNMKGLEGKDSLETTLLFQLEYLE